MRTFVTGATGFIGGEVVRRFASTPHQLVCLVRRPEARASLEQFGAQVVIGDVTRPWTFSQAMQGCDAVIHLAGAFDFWRRDRNDYRRVNVDGTRAVLEAALAAGVSKVVHVSTATVWGHTGGLINEETPLGSSCASEYARSKRAGDAIAWHLYEQRGLPLVVVYPAAVIGPGDPKAAGRYISRVAAGELPAEVCTSHWISLVHVRDVAAAILRALEKEGNVGARYLVSARALTYGELNQLVATAAHCRLPRFHLPDWMTIAGAFTLTAGAAVTRRTPAFDLAIDQVALMRQGFAVDGSKAERELGIRYTPLEEAIPDALGLESMPA